MTTNLLTGQTRNGLLFLFIKLCINDIFWSRVEFCENVHILVTGFTILPPMFNLFWLQLFLPKDFIAVNSLVLSSVDFSSTPLCPYWVASSLYPPCLPVVNI